ncbi:MAG: ABC transporter substrate-binding protein [Candidatus Binatia bacterium]|nr:ABC transporter substrate-binding protein [Candidatus Binatia bacterium]
MRKPGAARSLSRRQFLHASGMAALLANLPVGWAGRVFASDAPEKTTIRFGIIALTDCSSIVMAHELGLFKKYGIDSVISKEASWAVIRDRLILGENQATHMLYSMPYASTMGLFGAPQKPVVIPFVINRNGQAITLHRKYLGQGVQQPQQLRPLVAAAQQQGSPLTFAVTFPVGTHAMWMRYWLGAAGIHPDKDVSLITIPPPQMVANLKVGKMEGFCVGEPWNARAVFDKIGYTVITSQQIWKDHPEKVLAFSEEFVEKNPKTVKAILRAMFEASQYIDNLENRERVADIVSRPQYINCPKEVILGRLLGTYDYGNGNPVAEDPDYMTFFVRHTNFPWKSHGVWFLSQFRRWGMVQEPPEYHRLVDRVNRPDIYREVAKELGLDVPAEDYKTEILFDGVLFDPAKPEEYARSFPLHNVLGA